MFNNRFNVMFYNIDYRIYMYKLSSVKSVCYHKVSRVFDGILHEVAARNAATLGILHEVAARNAATLGISLGLP